MRAITAVIAIIVGFGSVNAIGTSKYQAAGQQKPAQQLVVLTVQGMT